MSYFDFNYTDIFLILMICMYARIVTKNYLFFCQIVKNFFIKEISIKFQPFLLSQKHSIQIQNIAGKN